MMLSRILFISSKTDLPFLMGSISAILDLLDRLRLLFKSYAAAAILRRTSADRALSFPLMVTSFNDRIPTSAPCRFSTTRVCAQQLPFTHDRFACARIRPVFDA